jgi:hypothetical protein
VTTLADFLLARVAEDEKAARKWCGDPNWSDVVKSSMHRVLAGAVPVISGAETALPHVARWDPARVLSECRAKRNPVEWADAGGNHFVLCQLAVPYEGHPAYCEDWREGPSSSYGD